VAPVTKADCGLLYFFISIDLQISLDIQMYRWNFEISSEI